MQDDEIADALDFADGNAVVLLGERRHFVDGLAFVVVPGADLDFALRVKDVELGDDE